MSFSAGDLVVVNVGRYEGYAGDLVWSQPEVADPSQRPESAPYLYQELRGPFWMINFYNQDFDGRRFLYAESELGLIPASDLRYYK